MHIGLMANTGPPLNKHLKIWNLATIFETLVILFFTLDIGLENLMENSGKLKS